MTRQLRQPVDVRRLASNVRVVQKGVEHKQRVAQRGAGVDGGELCAVLAAVVLREAAADAVDLLTLAGQQERSEQPAQRRQQRLAREVVTPHEGGQHLPAEGVAPAEEVANRLLAESGGGVQELGHPGGGGASVRQQAVLPQVADAALRTAVELVTGVGEQPVLSVLGGASSRHNFADTRALSTLTSNQLRGLHRLAVSSSSPSAGLQRKVWPTSSDKADAVKPDALESCGKRSDLGKRSDWTDTMLSGVLCGGKKTVSLTRSSPG